MKATHTPGPWVGSQHPSDTRGYVTIRPANNLRLIGTIYDARDAALVAAAPELLAAAHRGIAALAANGAPNCEAAKELRAAIAKAEGRE